MKQLWHMQNVWDVTSDAHRTVLLTREAHKVIIDFVNCREPTRLLFGQYELAITQIGFVSYLVLHPKESGLDNPSHEELHDYIHFWRAIGYLMGLDDKYNACAGTYGQCVTLFRDVEREIVLKNISQPSPQYKEIVTWFVNSSLPGVSAEALLAYCRAMITGRWTEEREQLAVPDRQRMNMLRGYLTALRVDQQFLHDQNEFFMKTYLKRVPKIL